MRSRRPGREALVSGASSIDSIEKRLWRILGCLDFFRRGPRSFSARR